MQTYTQVCKQFQLSVEFLPHYVAIPLRDRHLSNTIYLDIKSLLINKVQQHQSFTSPKCESPRGPLVSVCAMMTFTPGRILNEKQMFKIEVKRT